MVVDAVQHQVVHPFIQQKTRELPVRLARPQGRCLGMTNDLDRVGGRARIPGDGQHIVRGCHTAAVTTGHDKGLVYIGQADLVQGRRCPPRKPTGKG